MRNFILLMVLLIAACVGKVSAQTFFFDDFSNSALPGWTAVNNSTGNVIWKWANSGTSGGTSPGTFQYAGASNGYVILDSDGDGDQDGSSISENSTLTSAAINCSGKPAVILSFYEYFANYNNDIPRVQISTDSSTWTDVYDPSQGGTIGVTNDPNFVELNISSQAANQATVYIRFSWKGDWDYWWFVDDVKLRVPDSYDVQALALNNRLSNGCLLTNAESLSITFRNWGMTDLTSVTAKYSINNGAPVSETLSAIDIAFDSVVTYTFTTPADLSAAGTYNILAWVETAGDTILSNDSASSFAISANPIDLTMPYTMGFEVPSAGTEIGAYTWTSEDVNADGDSWFLSSANPNNGSVNYRYSYNPNAAADDWLYSPCLTMSGTKAYVVDFWDETGADANGNYPEKLELKTGTSPSAAAMTQSIVDLGAISDTGAYSNRRFAFKPASSGIYYVGFHVYSDPNEWFLNIDDVTISELAAPTAAFTPHLANKALSVSDASVDFITSWNWNWGDGSSDTGHIPPTHTYTTYGSYNVCLTVANLAGTDSICHTVNVINGINTLEANQIGVYPNPTKGQLNVALTGSFNNGQVEIQNLLGETLITRETKGNSIERFELSKLASGVYFVKVTADGVNSTQKFVYAK